MFGKDDHPINYKKIFSDYLCVTFYVLKKRPLKDAAEREMITNKMTRIMTGKISKEYINKRLVENIDKVNENKKNLNWRQGTDTITK
jgi:hypothetical protein